MKQKDRIFKLNENKIELPSNSIVISYSQFSKWRSCPKSWKLAYIDKLKISKPSIHAIFGTAMHRCIQSWVEILLTDSVKKSEEMDLNTMLSTYMKEEYKKSAESYKAHFSTKEELSEFYLDGVEILKWLQKKRNLYFSTKYTQFVGCEIPILLPPDPKKPNVFLMGFLDIVTRDIQDGIFTIQDIKTSTRGWSKWEKSDETKISQLRLYKKYFSEQYGIPLDKIKIEYLILKRKIDENSEFPQRRIQQFNPADGSVSMNKVSKIFQEFLDDCFLETGYNKDATYHPIAGEKFKNCRFCEFNDERFCPMNERICV